MSCSTLLDVEELWIKGSSANECLFRASEGLPLHLPDWCIFKQNLKSKWKHALVFSLCFHSRVFLKMSAVPASADQICFLPPKYLNPFSAHFAFPSFKAVEQGHREGNCRIVVRTMEMHVFSTRKGAVGVGRSAIKFLPPSLPAGWWVWGWEFLPLFQFWLSPAWEERWVIVAAAPLTPITAPLYHQGAFLFWELPLLSLILLSLWETMMHCKDQWQKKNNKTKKERQRIIIVCEMNGRCKPTKERTVDVQPHDVPAGLAYLGHPVGQPEEPRRAISPGLSAQMAFFKN